MSSGMGLPVTQGSTIPDSRFPIPDCNIHA